MHGAEFSEIFRIDEIQNAKSPLFDSGFSGFAVVGERTLKVLKFCKVLKKYEISDKVHFQFGDGKTIQASEIAQLQLACPNGKFIKFNAHILRNSDLPLLLGERFLQATQANLHYDSRNVTIFSDVFGVYESTNNASKEKDVSQDLFLTVPAEYKRDKKLQRNLTLKFPKYSKLWNLSWAQLVKLHSQRHVSAAQTVRNLQAVIPEELTFDTDVREFFKNILATLELIRKNCDICAQKQRSAAYPQLLSDISGLNFNDKVSADLIIGRNGNPYSWIILVDHATGFTRIDPFLGRATYDLITTSVLTHWFSPFGASKLLIVDQEGPLLKATKYFESLGTAIQTRPSGSHAPAGRVERRIGTFRESSETDLEFFKTADIIQMRAWTSLVENSMNNVQGANNTGSPTLRLLGFQTSLDYNALNDSQNSAYFPWETRDHALKSFRQAITSESFRRSLASGEATPSLTIFEPGQPVWVSQKTTAEKCQNRQSAQVLSYDFKTQCYTLRTTSGGVISVSHRDVVRRYVENEHDDMLTGIAGDVREAVPDGGAAVAGAAAVDNGCPKCKNRRSKKAHTCGKARNFQNGANFQNGNFQGPAIFKTDEDFRTTEVPQAQESKSKSIHDASEFVNDLEVMLFKDYDNIFTIAELNSYALNWDLLPNDVQAEAYREAADVYFRNGVWKNGPENEMNDEKFRNYAKSKKLVKLDGCLVKKAKVDPKNPTKVKGKCRLAIRGYKDRLNDNTNNESPTAHPTTIQLNEFFGLRNTTMKCAAIDYENAFFKIDEASQTQHLQYEAWSLVPPELVGGRRIWRRLHKEAQGMRGASRSWYETLRIELEKFGFTVSRSDPCLFLFWGEQDGKMVLQGSMVVHVDDARFWATTDLHKKFANYLKQRNLFSDYNFGYSHPDGTPFPECEDPDFSSVSKTVFLGADYLVDLSKRETVISQMPYINAKLKYLPIGKSEKDPDTDLQHRMTEFLEAMGSLLWITTKTCRLWSFEASYLASKRNCLKTEHFQAYNQVVTQIKEAKPKVKITGITGRLKLIFLCDGSETSTKTDRGYTGRIVAFMSGDLAPGTPGICTPISIRCGKSPRATHSSYDVESIAAVQVLDEGLCSAVTIQEFLRAPTKRLMRYERFSFMHDGATKLDFTPELHSDAELLVNGVNLTKRVDPTLGARRREDVDDLKSCLENRDLALVAHVQGATNPPDRLTKNHARTVKTHAILRTVFEENFYTPIFGKRKI